LRKLRFSRENRHEELTTKTPGKESGKVRKWESEKVRKYESQKVL